MWAWGGNNDGQLGDGTTFNKYVPAQVVGLTNTAKVVAGVATSLALAKDGTLWAWGTNLYGQLGVGSTTRRDRPMQVSGLTGVVAVATRGAHSLAVKSDGTVWAWGLNNYGQLGDGTRTDRNTPVQVPGLSDVVDVATSQGHSLALKRDGTVWAWGDNYYGQLGNGTKTQSLVPVQVVGLTGVSKVAAGGASFSLAVKNDGTVWAWGSNSSGELGDGTTMDRPTPGGVTGISGVVNVAAGASHVLALKNDGTVWFWGDNSNCTNDGTSNSTATPIAALPPVPVVAPLADFSGDHLPDILWRNYATGANTVWYMNGATRTDEVALPSRADVNWTISASADFNSDGVPDLLWRNIATGANSVWYMNGTTLASEAALPSQRDLNWKLVGVGDFNLDGQPDLVWHNNATGASSVWLMNGVARSSEVELPVVAADTDWRIAAVGDLNGDGKADLLWRHTSTGDDALWLMDGTTRTSNIPLTAVVDTTWEIVGVGDFNADGRADILWRNRTSGANSVWLMDGATKTGELTPLTQPTQWTTGTGTASVTPSNRTPVVVSASPGAGTAASQAFTFTVSDADGWQDLGVVNVLVNSALDGRHACYLAYARSINVLYLVNDAGTALLPGLVVNGTGTLSNSQCTITNPTVSGAGNTMTLAMNMSFPTTFAGNKVFYMAARDSLENNSGWQPVATWSVPPAVTTSPRVTGMTPGLGSGTGGQVTFQFSDSSGWQNLGVVNMLLNTALDGRYGCYMAYARTINVLYLVNDAGTALLPGLVVNGTGTLSNSQCTITNPTVSGSGDTMTLQMNISYGANFTGNRIWYLAARDVLENNSGWQTAGSWAAY